MASGDISLNFSLQDIDTHPLLMEHSVGNNEHHREEPIVPENQAALNEFRGIHPVSMPSSPQENVHIAIDAPSISPSSAPSQAQVDYPAANSLGRSSSASSRLQLIPRNSLLRRSSSTRQRRNGNQYSNPQRNNPLNSGWWIAIELAITVSQILASIIVLSVSRHEKPKAPLDLWVIGYTTGCVAILPLLYWRYRQRHARQQDEDAGSLSMASSSRTAGSPHTILSTSQHTRPGEDLESGLPISGGHQVANGSNPRYFNL